MRSLILDAPRHFSELDIPEPELPGKGFIKVRHEASVICGTDIPYWRGDKSAQTFPLEPGRPIHESAGRVVESSSAMFEPGDHVVAMPMADQGLAEYYVCPENEAVKTPKGCENDDAAVLIQPLCTVLNGVDRLGDVSGKRVTVVGAGPIGLLAIWLLKDRGAGQILAVDPVGVRLDAAKRLGADEVLEATGSQARAMLRSDALAFGEADLTVEAVGHCQQTASDVVHLTRRLGTVLALGVPDCDVYAFDYNALFRKNLCFITAVTPDWRLYMDKAAELFADKGEEIAFLIGHRLPLERAAEGFALAESRQCLKVLLDACEFGT